MAEIQGIARIVVRQATSTTAAAATSAFSTSQATCTPDNDYDGRIGLRVSAIFVIMAGSMFGAVFPIFAQRNKGVKVPELAFFIAKYFGSGVIIATAFIHLLAPASDALTDPCLTGVITEYDWAEGIALIAIFLLFFIELMAMRFSTFGHDHEHDNESNITLSTEPHLSEQHMLATLKDSAMSRSHSRSHSHTPGDDHLGHTREHNIHETTIHENEPTREDYAAQMTAIFILEFGVIFHSIFVGLTLAVAGKEFNTLYVVLVFHQTFEGLGLGSRLAAMPWPPRKRLTPYFLAVGYGISTPIAMAVGLGLRKTYQPGSQTSLIVNGVFDSISAGILIYTGLVELLAHEFMFSEVMRRAKLTVVLSAFGFMCLGAGLMALLGKWA